MSEAKREGGDPRRVTDEQAATFANKWRALARDLGDPLSPSNGRVDRLMRSFHLHGDLWPPSLASQRGEAQMAEWCALGVEWLLAWEGDGLEMDSADFKGMEEATGWRGDGMVAFREAFDAGVDRLRALHNEEGERRVFRLVRQWMDLHPFEWFVVYQRVTEAGEWVVGSNVREYILGDRDMDVPEYADVGLAMAREANTIMKAWLKSMKEEV